jgi:phage tail sheath protein FI
VILTVPKGSQPTDATDWFQYKLARFSNYAAIYWPWIQIADPLTSNRAYVVPPMGHIAGIYARTDSTRNVGKAPGGTVDGALQFLIGLERNNTQGERDTVYPKRINPLINSSQTGLAVWGVRTIASDSTWRYINARRLFMFVEKSIYNSTQWIVFENNGQGLWARIKAQINGFLGNLFNDGYFAGTSPNQAFFVICDETNNTAASISAGQVVIDVGIAPNKPAEFVRFQVYAKIAVTFLALPKGDLIVIWGLLERESPFLCAN